VEDAGKFNFPQKTAFFEFLTDFATIAPIVTAETMRYQQDTRCSRKFSATQKWLISRD
jgi:hypothetical protein